MVARKSQRVKKSTVVYQSPEQVPRASRNVTPKTVPPRRSSNRDIELQMECVDDELSPAQLKAIKEAQKEHEKANDLIKEVRAGNILVPSSQPNTFTIVPPKPPPPPPPQPPQPPAQHVQPLAAKVQSPPQDTGSQRGLPPPRPAQFLSKQLKEMNKAPGPRSSPDVILISDTPAMSATSKTMPATMHVSQVSGNQLQMQQVTTLLTSQGPGATPQQVYKFVSLPSNMPANVVQNQWALRPLLTVSPQQQSQMTFLTPTVTPRSGSQLVGSVPQGQGQMPAPRPTVASKYVKIDNQNLAIKRPSPNELAASQPAAKKKNPKVAEISDQSGNWIPLDEYYYGTHDGDASYTEEKGEYRFKCWYCSKMLYNNVRAMQHIQGHIDASKQQNIDLSDLTQCKHCYKQFDTPFEMQTHVEKVHLSNKVLMCRICEKDFSTPRELTVHMKGNHHACEMPYVCHLCNFKSSMYSDVVDHFKKKHDSSHYMLCLYCLRTFEVKFVSQGWGQTQTYYGHLLKHQTKSATKKCVVCRLTFFNAQDVKNHRKNCHVGNFKDVKALTSGSKTDSGQKQKKGSSLKSLNAPSVSRIQDYGEIIFPAEASNTKCVECKMLMSSTDHYKKYVHCSMCRFATSCSVAYANHMMGFHSGQMSSLNLNIPWERPMKEIMYCACGFNSKYGNKIANHLVYCAKRTCYTTKRTQSDTTTGSTGDEKKEGSILGMLGLVQKSVVATTEETDEIRSKPKLDIKSGLEEPNKIRESKVKANISELKSGDKTDTVDTKEKSEEKESREITDVEYKPITVSETTKPSDKEDEKPIDISSSSEESFMDKSNFVDESDKVIEISEKEKPEEQADITEAGKEEEVSENLKSKHEKEVIDADIGCEQIKSSEDAQLETDTQSVQDKRSSATEKEKEVIKYIEEVMDTERVNEPDETSEDAQPPKMGAGMIPSEDELASKDDSTLAKDEENDMDTKETETQESLKAKNDSVAMEESEPLNENADDSEMDTLLEAVESPKPILETKDESDQKETSDFKQSELGNSGTDSVSEETGNVDSLENEKEELEPTTERTEELTEPPIKTDEKGGEDEAVEEKDTEESKEEQDLTDSSEEKEKPKEEEKPPEDTEPKEQEKPKEIESTSQKESCDHGDSRTSSGDHKDPSDRRSQERPDDRRDSSDRHSQERPGDRRDSSDHHSKERYDSRDRPHSGSSDRSRHDDKSRQEDRHRQENRSYGSSRSDSYHGNRSSYDSNRDRDRSYDRDRDRDRSYDRDRDRDYNRNRDYRHGDSRSGHGYQDNRGQGYRGQGQYGGYQGNRGGHHQDRNFNRNYQNRGGYNQNYRGGYRGGYY